MPQRPVRRCPTSPSSSPRRPTPSSAPTTLCSFPAARPRPTGRWSSESSWAGAAATSPTSRRREAAIAGYHARQRRERTSLPAGAGRPVGQGQVGGDVQPVRSLLATPDELPDVLALGMWLDVNGVRRQTGTTGTMLFGPAYRALSQPVHGPRAGRPPQHRDASRCRAWGWTPRSGCSRGTSWSWGSTASASSVNRWRADSPPRAQAPAAGPAGPAPAPGRPARRVAKASRPRSSSVSAVSHAVTEAGEPCGTGAPRPRPRPRSRPQRCRCAGGPDRRSTASRVRRCASRRRCPDTRRRHSPHVSAGEERLSQ